MELFKKLNSDKIKINWNKKPIKMELFLSFLTVDLELSKDHWGHGYGWTKRFNDSVELVITGGIVSRIEYLDSIQYKNKIENPFYIFDFLNQKGKKFFIDYYRSDIDQIKSELINNVDLWKSKIEKANTEINSIEKFLDISLI